MSLFYQHTNSDMVYNIFVFKFCAGKLADSQPSFHHPSGMVNKLVPALGWDVNEAIKLCEE